MIAEELIKGLIIGICVSAPVGPLGVLCIQRTISRGRWHGVITGLGATTSDIIYALIVGFSMNLITDFINAHMHTIQLVGAIIIFFFGLSIFRTKPEDVQRYNINKKKQQRQARQARPRKQTAAGRNIDQAIDRSPRLKRFFSSQMFKDYISAFGLCFSNPLIIFLFIGLFAQFQVLTSDSSLVNTLTIISILLGAFLWWLILTSIVGHFKDNFKQRGLRILNRCTGGFLIIAALLTAAEALINIYL